MIYRNDDYYIPGLGLYLKHSGVGHLDGGHSGRYPWGSGENPYQRCASFMSSYRKLRDEGYTNDDISEKWGCSVAEAFMMSYNELKSSGKNDTEIASMWDLTTTEFRPLRTQYSAEVKQSKMNRARYLRYGADGNIKMSIPAISKEMGESESTIRGWLKDVVEDRQSKIDSTADAIREYIDKGNYVDISKGINAQLGVGEATFKAAIKKLEEEGYTTTKIQQEQLGTQFKTTIKIICPPGTTYAEANANHDKIVMPIDTVTFDKGNTYTKLQYPTSIDSNRIMIKYDDVTYEDGFNGTARDGLIQLRRGVDDLSLGHSNYAQVRIMVDDKYYLKGMAMYKDDMPDGVDIIFNTNKNSSAPLEKVLKPIKESKDPQAVFGATIKAGGQSYYEDDNGKFKGEDIGLDPGKLYSLSAINKVNEEGDWSNWSKTLASQMLSKQTAQLAKKQLDLAMYERKKEYEDIMSLENEVLKKSMLLEFADGCDSAAVDLKAAALPRQASQVLVPIPSLKDDEIYAPNYKNGETVVLIRYPHGGPFEIPQLTVNNNQKEAKASLGVAKDAVGVSIATASKLSGADFDGDTALVIPNNNGAIISTKSLEGLQNFEPKIYKNENLPKMPDKTKQREMGSVSNLISDMNLQKASEEELARAVRHSMVVIDAQKHSLDYKQSYRDNNIAELQKKYQIKENGRYGGASTLISRASSEERVPERKLGGPVKDENGNYILTSNGKPKKFMINPYTGEKVYSETGNTYKEYKAQIPDETKKSGYTTKWVTYSKLASSFPDEVDQNGNTDYDKLMDHVIDTRLQGKTTKSTKMYETKDAYSLSSGTLMESIYAEYANGCKALGNQARKDSLVTVPAKKDPEAAKKYKAQIDSIDEKIRIAEMNKPLERQAQIIAGQKAANRIKEEGVRDDNDKIKKIKAQELAQARAEVGASSKDSKVKLTEDEWEAISNNAISPTKQEKLFANCDKDRLKELAMPKEKIELNSIQINRIQSMARSGNYTQAEIAESLGVSVSTVRNYLDI